MGTPYPGFNSFPVDITVPDGSDDDDAATVAVSVEQLADRTKWLEARVTGGSSGAELTDAILHGNTTMPDGSLVADLTGITLHSDNDFTLDTDADLHVTADGNIIVTADSIDLLGGTVLVGPTMVELGTNVDLGGGTGDTVTVLGTLAASHNATFAAGKTLALHGATTADDLRATVSNAAGLTFSGNGRIQYRKALFTDGNFSGGVAVLNIVAGDIWYATSITVTTPEMWLTTGTDGNILILSVKGCSGLSDPITVKNFDGTSTLLSGIDATHKCFSIWLCLGGTNWRLLHTSDT